MRDVLLTIDTEGPRGSDPIKFQIWGKVNDEEYGIPKIIECCDKYGIKGLFFVDIPEVWDYGYDKIEKVIRYIIDKGHNVGVHIHPHHIQGESRQFLYEFSKEEQRKIIKDCTEIYQKITGKMPYSFRAGKYGANMETLEILQELGYKYDFSEFYTNRWCGIKPEVAYTLPQKIGGIIEFPVTVFRSLDFLGIYQRYDKLEITSSYGEIKHIIDLYSRDGNVGVIILFLHSFSFINYLDTPDSPTLNQSKLKTFEKVLKYVASADGLRAISEEDLQVFREEKKDTPENIVETRGLIKQIWYSYLRIFRIRKSNRKAKIVIYGSWLFFFLIVLLIAFVLWR